MDLPSALQARAAEMIDDRDHPIVEGWMAKQAPPKRRA